MSYGFLIGFPIRSLDGFHYAMLSKSKLCSYATLPDIFEFRISMHSEFCGILWNFVAHSNSKFEFV